MPKLLAPILTVAIVAALAGVLYVRLNVWNAWDGETTDIVVEPVSSSKFVRYVVRDDEGQRAFHYDLDRGVSSPEASVANNVRIRFTQSSELCGNDWAAIPLRIRCDQDDDVLQLTMIDGDGKSVLRTTIDPRDLGVMPSAAEGYLVPVAVAEDKSAIYLGRRVETESWVAGLWKLDVATGEVSEVEYVRERKLYQYDINPATKQLFGVTFQPPESLGEEVSGPSSQHLVDLTTGNGVVMEESVVVYENPMLSEDGSRYAFRESGEGVGTGRTVVLAVESGRYSGGWEIDGIMRDWFGDTLVFDRDGNLFLYDLKTKAETQITHETDATVEYVGVAR